MAVGEQTAPACLGPAEPWPEKFVAAGLYTVLLACKTDPDQTPEVDPWHGNALGQKQHVGLIEVTSLTTEGRGKMKNGLRWLLYKIEHRHRKSSQLAGGYIWRC